MRKSPVEVILTTYSVTMFGPKASIHQQEIDEATMLSLIGPDTQIVATRQSHESMAKQLCGDLPVTRFADMSPDSSAIAIHYRGAPISETGQLADGGVVTYYLIESEDYLEEED